MMTHIKTAQAILLDTNTSQAERYFAQNNNLSPLLFLGLFLWLIFIGKSLKRRSGKIGARITRQKALSILVYMKMSTHVIVDSDLQQT